MNKQNDPFALEALRAKLAQKKNYKKLKATYSEKYPEIKDLNTPKLWDYLHFEDEKAAIAHPMAVDRLQIVSKLIQGGDLSVLDIGFGSASLEKVFFSHHGKKKYNWNGIEISPVSIKKAKEAFPYAKFKKGNILKLDFLKNTFDYVIALEVLEHIKPSKTFIALQEIYRVIKPGKYFIVSVPMNEGLPEMVARGQNPNAHVRTYTPEVIKAELEIAGFIIVQEKKLFAFHKFYKSKSFLANYFFSKRFRYNNIIVLAQKPLT